jgi:hypothetical protein
MSKMRRLLIFLLLISPALAFGQDTLPELRVEPTGGGSFFYVRNTASQPLTAFLIELVDYPGSSYSFWQDDVNAEPIAPGAEQKIRVSNMTVGAVPDYVKMEAALYEDGTTRGAPDKIAELLDRRRSELGILHDLIGRLQKAQTAGTPKASVGADLKQWADSLQPPAKTKRNSQTAINNAAARTLILDTAASLDTRSIEEVLAGLQAAEHRAAITKTPS